MEGLSYERSDGSWQKIEVGVDDGDFERQMANWSIDPSMVSVSNRHAVLALIAEMFVFERMKVARQHDSDWHQERDALQRQIKERAGAIIGRLRA